MIRFEKRSIALCIVLSIVTCGIYYYYWFYCIARDFDEHRTPGAITTTAGMTLLLTIVTCGIYGIYAYYKWGKQGPEVSAYYQRGVEDRSVLYLILALFGLDVINMALIQSDFNELADIEAGNSPMPPAPGGPYGGAPYGGTPTAPAPVPGYAPQQPQAGTPAPGYGTQPPAPSYAPPAGQPAAPAPTAPQAAPQPEAAPPPPASPFDVQPNEPAPSPFEGMTPPEAPAPAQPNFPLPENSPYGSTGNDSTDGTPQ